jgi:hypothetical protein
MTIDEKQDAILRYLKIYARFAYASDAKGISNWLAAFFPELRNDDGFYEETKNILSDFENRGLLTGNDATLMVAGARVVVRHYTLTDIGTIAALLIHTEHVLNILLDFGEKDKLLFEIVFDSFNPRQVLYKKYEIREAIDRALDGKPAHEICRLKDHSSEDRMYKFFKEKGFIKIISADGEFKFNSRGRKLLSIGSYEKFIEQESIEEEEEKQRKLLSDKILSLNIDNIEIQNKQMWFNFWIAIGTSIGAIYSAILIIQSINSIKLETKSTFILFLFASSLGATIALSIQAMVRKNNK